MEIKKERTKVLSFPNPKIVSFVVNTDDDKLFKRGDVLKAAGFNAPARNAPRGNVLNGGFNINWTGPEYL